MDINSIFAQPAPKVKEEIKGAIVEEEPELPYNDPAKTEAENREREQRTVFVGNIPISSEKKNLQKLFKGAGEIEKIWIRSVPVDTESKISVKGKVILKQYVSNASSKNCYILFSKQEEAQKAVSQFNSAEFEGRHLHVTLAKTIDKDYKTTVFVGNLTYETDEEDLRNFFLECGVVDYVRVVRDKFTHKCLGFAYVKFTDKLAMLNALNLNGKEFKGRLIRVFKARKSNVNSRDNKQEDKNKSISPQEAYAIRKGQNVQNDGQKTKAPVNEAVNPSKPFSTKPVEKRANQRHFESKPKFQQSNKPNFQQSNKKPFDKKPRQNQHTNEDSKKTGPQKGKPEHQKPVPVNNKPEGNGAAVPKQKKIKKPFGNNKHQDRRPAKKAQASN